MIRERTPASEIVINLDGPDGNAFRLLATAKKYAHWERKKVSQITAEMTSGDYTHLVKTFDKYFGHLVVLETTQQELLNELS